MLQGYVDDSGSDGRQPSFVLAGYILEAEKWAAFADDWKAELDRPPAIKYFKMSECAEGEGKFEGIGLPFRKCKARDLLGIINKHNPDGICSYLHWEQWREFERDLPPQIKQPYVPLFFNIVDTVVAYEKNLQIFPEKIQIDFDEQGNAGQFALEWYSRLREFFPPEHSQIFGRSPTMLDDQEYVALQAADMLAWNVRRRLEGSTPEDPWFWLYDELRKTLWGGLGFSKHSWDSLKGIVREHGTSDV